jgi:hypothetical protein
MRILILITALIFSACVHQNTLDVSASQRIIDAIQTDNLPALKEVLSTVPAAPGQRSESDQNLVNQALQMTASKGQPCNLEMANYLYGFGALADYFHMSSGDFGGFRSDFKKYKVPLCGNFLLDSHRKYLNRTVDPLLTSEAYERQQNEIKNMFVKSSYNNVIAFLNNVDYNNPTELSYGIQRFKEVAHYAIEYGKAACAKDLATDTCVSYGYYKKLADELLTKKDFAKKSDAYKQLKAFSDHLRQNI